MLSPLFNRKRYEEEYKHETTGQLGYLVLRRLSTKGWLIKECVARWKRGDEEGMMRALRWEVRKLRGFRRYVSLKGGSGFGLYEVRLSSHLISSNLKSMH